MIAIRKAEERGAANFDWLDTKHTFSFGQYYDPKFMGFGPLRVINDDRVAPAKGFGTHPHDNMEIVTYILEGALEHKDSMGTGSVILPGDVQRMSAGTGITHSEYNPSKTDPVHLLQIWFLPKKRGIQPSYEQKHFPSQDKRGKLVLVGSETGRNGSVVINQDVDMYAALIDKNEVITHALSSSRRAWVHVARGSVSLNGQVLKAGDGVAVADETIRLENGRDAEIILFDIGAQAD
ncbi:MAG: pirin family protein [Alphaproteobacteria bacterium]